MESNNKIAHHVLPSENGGWDIKKTNAKRISRHFDTKQEAVEAARKMSEREGTELIIHDKHEKVTKETKENAAKSVEKTPVTRSTPTAKPKTTPARRGVSGLSVALGIAILLFIAMLVYFWYLGLFDELFSK